MLGADRVRPTCRTSTAISAARLPAHLHPASPTARRAGRDPLIESILAWKGCDRARKGRCSSGRAAVRVAFIGVLSHPLLDRMNTYGFALFEPCRTAGITATPCSSSTGSMAADDAGSASNFRGERSGIGRNWMQPASLRVTERARLHRPQRSRRLVRSRRREPLVERVGPPLIVGRRGAADLLAAPVMDGEGTSSRGTADFTPFSGARPDPKIVPLNLDDPRLAIAARSDADVCEFLFWSRMPLVIDLDGKAYLSDQRFTARRPFGGDPAHSRSHVHGAARQAVDEFITAPA